MPLNEFTERYPNLIERLKQANKNGRIAHGYILTGDQFKTLEKFATSFFQLCACQSPCPDGDACGVCTHCRQIRNELYPHLKAVRPQSKSRQILVDDISELEYFLHLTSGGALRIAAIYDADRMNVQTQNGFLKTLEEPGAHTLIMLITRNPSLLLPTIRSRCQMLGLHDNRIEYELPDAPRLFNALSLLQPRAGAQKATSASEEIVTILAQLRQECEDDAKTYLQELANGADQLEPAQRKRQKDEAEALLESRYRGRRASFLSAIHTWFSQEYIRANGVAPNALPNPEFYAGMDEYLNTVSTPPKLARHSLSLAEKLVETLNYNVDEHLAVDDFCQSVCQK